MTVKCVKYCSAKLPVSVHTEIRFLIGFTICSGIVAISQGLPLCDIGMLVSVFQVDELPQIVSDLASNRRSWEDVLGQYPVFEQQETTT